MSDTKRMIRKKKSPRRAGARATIDARQKGLVQTAEPARDRNWASLDAAFQVRLAATLAALDAQGAPFALVEGFRTVPRQQWLYGSGRAGAVPYGRPGPIVTYKDGVKNLSNHQGTGVAGSGRAADCYPLRNGKVFIPPSADPLWEKYAVAAEAQGLGAGHHWKSLRDSPAIEETVLAAAREPLRKKLQEAAGDFIASVPIPGH